MHAEPLLGMDAVQLAERDAMVGDPVVQAEFLVEQVVRDA